MNTGKETRQLSEIRRFARFSAVPFPWFTIQVCKGGGQTVFLADLLEPDFIGKLGG